MAEPQSLWVDSRYTWRIRLNSNWVTDIQADRVAVEDGALIFYNYVTGTEDARGTEQMMGSFAPGRWREVLETDAYRRDFVFHEASFGGDEE